MTIIVVLMNNFIHIFIFFFNFAFIQLFGIVVQAPYLDMIEKNIIENENALVVFDVDAAINNISLACNAPHQYTVKSGQLISVEPFLQCSIVSVPQITSRA